MLPPFLGMLLTLATALIVGMCLLVALWSAFKGYPTLLRGSLFGGAGMGVVYGCFFAAGLLLAPDRLLPPGEAVKFCGLDCHLHVAVDQVHPGSELGVVVRFSSNAVRAPEWPSELEFRLVDLAGESYRPLNSIPDSALRAGQSWIQELRFPGRINPKGARLVVTWKPGLDYLVPGAGNPLVQRRIGLALQ